MANLRAVAAWRSTPNSPQRADDASSPALSWLALGAYFRRVPDVAFHGIGRCAAVLSPFSQASLIYGPRRYGEEDFLGAPEGLKRVLWQERWGQQTAFYFPPRGQRGDEPPEVLWMLHGGNCGTAMDWRFFIRDAPFERCGWLAVDYPGFGECAGTPNPGRILANSKGAFRRLCEMHKWAQKDIEPRLRLFGHSMGAAAALQLAAGVPVKGIVLVSPFTRILDMARLLVGWPLCYLVMHRFDNEARLRELAARPQPPRVIVVHGDRDDVIPFAMSRRLARLFPDLIDLRTIRGGDHNMILDTAREFLYEAMSEVLPVPRVI